MSRLRAECGDGTVYVRDWYAKLIRWRPKPHPVTPPTPEQQNVTSSGQG